VDPARSNVRIFAENDPPREGEEVTDRPTRLSDETIADLRVRAEAQRGAFVDPKILYSPKRLHNKDWAAFIVGQPDFDVFFDWPTMWLLYTAMQLEPDPPETRAQAADREYRAQYARMQEEARTRLREVAAQRYAADTAAWAKTLSTCLVKVEVRENTTARVRGGRREALRHVTPLSNAASGTRRFHPAGRPLCEKTNRAKPLRLADEPATEHATCISCVALTAQIRQAGEPAPKRARGKRPTAAQRALLVLIDAGKVATVSHLRGGTDVRIPSEPSPSARCGALGRKVTAQADALAAAGWARPREKGARNTPWVLTDAGRTALEGA
jgi:hypothetical protein